MALGWNKAQRQQRSSAMMLARSAEKRVQRYIVSCLLLVGDVPVAPASLRRGWQLVCPRLADRFPQQMRSISATAWRIGST